MTTVCEFSGDSDMYGLGIRVGSYLQWMSLLIAACYVPSELPGLRTSNAFLTSATFIGLVVETALKDLEITEIYVTMLLVFGSQYVWLTAMLWRVFTPSDSETAPVTDMEQPKSNRIPWISASKMHWFSYTLLQVSQIGFQMWFWIFKIAKFARRENTCQRFGFGFYKFGLTSDGFRIFNIILKVSLLVLTIVLLALYPQYLRKKAEHRRQRSQGAAPKHRKKVLYMAFQIASVAIVILAIELTISWNRIQDVNCAKTIGQFIPLMISIAGVAQLLLAAYRAKRSVLVDWILQQGADRYAKLAVIILGRPTQDDDERQSTVDEVSEKDLKGPQVTVTSLGEDV